MSTERIWSATVCVVQEAQHHHWCRKKVFRLTLISWIVVLRWQRSSRWLEWPLKTRLKAHVRHNNKCMSQKQVIDSMEVKCSQWKSVSPSTQCLCRLGTRYILGSVCRGTPGRYPGALWFPWWYVLGTGALEVGSWWFWTGWEVLRPFLQWDGLCVSPHNSSSATTREIKRENSNGD